MPSFSAVMYAVLWHADRYGCDFVPSENGVGWNVYRTSVVIDYQSGNPNKPAYNIPVTILHNVLAPPLTGGQMVRVTGNVFIRGRCFLVIATSLAPTHWYTPQASWSFPHVTLDGVVSSGVTFFREKSGCYFEVKVDRSDLFPSQLASRVRCFVNRQTQDFEHVYDLSINTPIFVSGTVCGWTLNTDTLVIDVDDMDYTASGAIVAPVTALNPFVNAQYMDGWAIWIPRPLATAPPPVVNMFASPSMPYRPAQLPAVMPIPEGWQPTVASVDDADRSHASRAVPAVPSTSTVAHPISAVRSTIALD